VVQTFVHQAPGTLVLRFTNGERIETTPTHPFYVEHKGFTPAAELGIGTSIVTRAGPCAVLASIETRDAPATVYNFEVENTHTYFVGKSDLWVHNLCKARWVSFIYDGNGGVLEKAIDHIFNRHNINSTYTNVSKFYASYSNKSRLKALISDAVWKATPNDIISTTRTGDIRLVYDFGYNIGTTPEGLAASKIEIYMTAFGEVRTAYPVK